MSGSLEGTVAVVTGAGSGLGRAEALALAGAGASVVVGDLDESAKSVVDEIAEAGGTARFVPGDVGERDTADALTSAAVEGFGGLHILVNNAGITRDRMLFNATDAEWDDVIRVHLRGHFLLSRNAASYWRGKSKSDGAPVYGSVINTTSEAFLLGSEGQPNYAAAKAGIAALTTATARGMARYGVRANAICPRARTAMTSDIFGPAPESGIDPLSVDHVTPLVTYLASAEAERITGQVFVVHGGMVALMAPPAVEARFDAAEGQWSPAELAEQVGGYFDGRATDRMFAATEVNDLP
ncbi:3-oxoacyl-ACP reductase [Haloechinothrix sp. YIM 98757]|uniref:3-oxoacyl-ACP reductase n=1 Tax=Haloechinothrix aidingensis TaxID=2752311 RepID=A0A838ACQ3_9PSEU|nr:3-oxoacyl-ACP reductase [Haloechinothrix aidingensis]